MSEKFQNITAQQVAAIRFCQSLERLHQSISNLRGVPLWFNGFKPDLGLRFKRIGQELNCRQIIKVRSVHRDVPTEGVIHLTRDSHWISYKALVLYEKASIEFVVSDHPFNCIVIPNVQEPLTTNPQLAEMLYEFAELVYGRHVIKELVPILTQEA